MRKNVGIGRSLGHIEVPEGMLVGPREIDDFPDERVVIISTGSQGEPLSALRRMAYRDHPPGASCASGDTVVFSATPIPGNERAVNETIDRLYHIGCDVITPRDAPVHASGHGYAEEVKLMLNLVKPRYVMPFHGDFKRLRLHAQLAEAVGVAPEDIFQGDNGLPLDIDERGARFGEREQSGMIFVDGVEIGDMADVALRDRRMLSADGIFIVVVTIAEQDGQLGRRPRGDLPRRAVPRRGRRAVEEIRATVEDSLARAAEEEIREVDLLAADAARRPGEASLRPPQAAADGAARRRRGLSARRQAHDEARAGAALGAARSVTRAAVGLGDGPHDRQAEAEGAAAVAGAAHEALEQRRRELRRARRGRRPRRRARPGRRRRAGADADLGARRACGAARSRSG